jgi:hypothetical protein
MKKYLLLICPFLMLVSCVKEREKSQLIEYEIDGQTYAYTGYAIRYNDHVNDISKGIDWHVYNLGQTTLYIQAYDSSFSETLFAYPAFQAVLNVELKNGNSKTYIATAGEFRLLGQQVGDLTGDFHFKMKNILNPLDSVMIDNGYFRIWLEEYDRYFTK